MNRKVLIGKVLMIAGLFTLGIGAVHAGTSAQDVAKCERRFDKSPAMTTGPNRTGTLSDGRKVGAGSVVCIKLWVEASRKRNGSCDIAARCYPDELEDENGRLSRIKDSIITVTPQEARRVRNCDGIMKLSC